MITVGPLIFLTPPPVSGFFFIILLGWVVFLIVQRQNRRKLGQRLAAGMIATLALLALANPPELIISQKPATAVLLTRGAERQDLPDSLLQRVKVFAMPEIDTTIFSHEHIENVPDAGFLKRRHPEIDQLVVFGHGLPEFDWAELDSCPLVPHLATLSPGICALSWTRELQLGEKLRLQGCLAGVSPESNALYLFGPGGADSLKISWSADGQFEGSALPRAAGKFLYTLLLKSARGDTLGCETLDLVVSDPQPLRILMLSPSPSFEIKYLKAWASRNHHRLALRTLISRERYREEFINLPPIDLRHLNATLLQSFDVFMIEGSSWLALPNGERLAVRAATTSTGLGVLFMPDESILQNNKGVIPEWAGFDFETLDLAETRLIKPFWHGLDTLKMVAIPAEPFALKPAWGSQPIVTDAVGRCLAAAQVRGNGRVGLSLIRESYRWVLEGRSDLYAAYWSNLLSALAQGRARAAKWRLHTGGPIFIDQPLSFSLATRQNDPLGIVSTSGGQQDSVFLIQDSSLPEHWYGTYWPRQAGWHTLSAPSGQAFSFYVCENSQWQTWQQAQKAAATLRQAARFDSSRPRRLAAPTPIARPLSPFWFLLAFLVSAGYLWLERKLS